MRGDVNGDNESEVQIHKPAHKAVVYTNSKMWVYKERLVLLVKHIYKSYRLKRKKRHARRVIDGSEDAPICRQIQRGRITLLLKVTS